MFRLLAGGFALTILLTSGASGAAQDKKDKDKAAIWEREADGISLKLEVSEKAVIFHVMQGDNGAVVTTKKTVKDGVVMLEVTDVVEKGNFPPKPKKGLKLSFKWTEKDDTAKLSDLEGEGLENAKAVLEGEYKKKK